MHAVALEEGGAAERGEAGQRVHERDPLARAESPDPLLDDGRRRAGYDLSDGGEDRHRELPAVSPHVLAEGADLAEDPFETLPDAGRVGCGEELVHARDLPLFGAHHAPHEGGALVELREPARRA